MRGKMVPAAVRPWELELLDAENLPWQQVTLSNLLTLKPRTNTLSEGKRTLALATTMVGAVEMSIFLCKQANRRTTPVSRVKELDALPSLKPSITIATPCERDALQVSPLGSSPPHVHLRSIAYECFAARGGLPRGSPFLPILMCSLKWLVFVRDFVQERHKPRRSAAD
ncbi:hypothetical protein B296_00045286 [Ensete ventricosum]|uniref:Uncharacterized protein n=1 Tax=Ensete ventricosum TaxID=4639 RepID=A0A426Z366_ENSVE|nr:hypothetical protein B296_00045286 [Ensete ventricosum]